LTMTERRQFCPKGHDTFVVGRDSSYRCKRCKLDAGNEARWAREREAADVRRAEMVRQQDEATKRRAAEKKRILKAGGVKAQSLMESESGGRCSWATGEVQITADPPVLEGKPGICGRPYEHVGPYCRKHNRLLEQRQAKRKAEQAAAQAAERESWKYPEPTPEPEPEPDPPQVVPVERPRLQSVTAWGERGWVG
jgi:hypothetical protein